MTIIELESDWKTTGFYCPACKGDMYSDGVEYPECPNCYTVLDIEQMIFQMLEVAPMNGGYRIVADDLP